MITPNAPSGLWIMNCEKCTHQRTTIGRSLRDLGIPAVPAGWFKASCEAMAPSYLPYLIRGSRTP